MDLKELVELAKSSNDPKTNRSLSSKFQKLCKDYKVAKKFAELDGFKILRKYLKSEDSTLRRRAVATLCNISTDEKAHPLLREKSGIDLVYKLLKDYKNEFNTEKVLHNASAAMLNMCLDEKNRAYLIITFPDVVVNLLKASKAFKKRDEKESLSNVIECLSSLALESKASLEILKHIDFILKNFFINEENENILESSVNLVYNLCIDAKAKQVLSTKEPLLKKLALNKGCESKNIKKNSQKILMVLTSTKKKSEKLNSQEGGDEKKSTAQANTEKKQTLTPRSNSPNRLFENLTEVQKLVAELKNQETKDNRLRYCAATICNLCINNDKIKSEVREEGGIEALSDILKVNTNDEVIYCVAAAISSLSLLDENIELLYKLGCTSRLLKLLRETGQHKEEVTLHVINALNNLSTNESCRNEIRELNGVEVFVTFLYSENKVFVEKSASVLVNLSVDEECGRIIKDLGGLKKLYEIVSQPDANGNISEIKKKSVLALWNLKRTTLENSSEEEMKKMRQTIKKIGNDPKRNSYIGIKGQIPDNGEEDDDDDDDEDEDENDDEGYGGSWKELIDGIMNDPQKTTYFDDHDDGGKTVITTTTIQDGKKRKVSTVVKKTTPFGEETHTTVETDFGSLSSPRKRNPTTVVSSLRKDPVVEPVKRKTFDSAKNNKSTDLLKKAVLNHDQKEQEKLEKEKLKKIEEEKEKLEKEKLEMEKEKKKAALRNLKSKSEKTQEIQKKVKTTTNSLRKFDEIDEEDVVISDSDSDDYDKIEESKKVDENNLKEEDKNEIKEPIKKVQSTGENKTEKDENITESKKDETEKKEQSKKIQSTGENIMKNDKLNVNENEDERKEREIEAEKRAKALKESVHQDILKRRNLKESDRRSLGVKEKMPSRQSIRRQRNRFTFGEETRVKIQEKLKNMDIKDEDDQSGDDQSTQRMPTREPPRIPGKNEDLNERKTEERKSSEKTDKNEGGKEMSKTSTYLRQVEKISEGLIKEIQAGISFSLNNLNHKRDYWSPEEKQVIHNGFTSYYPLLFHKLRQKFKVKENEYLNSVCKGSMKIVITPGKSGALLFFTKDGQYIIKTVTKGEGKFLQKKIFEYADFMDKNDDTLLVKFVGFYSCKYNRRFIQFVVMNNIFQIYKMSTTYDLKGSWVGRKAGPGERVFKDLDILENQTKLKIDKDLKLLFVSQIRADTDFLAELNIMDYSLLLGIYNIAEKKLVDKELPKRKVGMGRLQIIESTDEKEIYFIGIIDILQLWNFKKKGELFLKQNISEKSGLSSIPPPEYSLRFKDFMTKLVI